MKLINVNDISSGLFAVPLDTDALRVSRRTSDWFSFMSFRLMSGPRALSNGALRKQRET